MALTQSIGDVNIVVVNIFSCLSELLSALFYRYWWRVLPYHQTIRPCLTMYIQKYSNNNLARSFYTPHNMHLECESDNQVLTFNFFGYCCLLTCGAELTSRSVEFTCGLRQRFRWDHSFGAEFWCSDDRRDWFGSGISTAIGGGWYLSFFPPLPTLRDICWELTYANQNIPGIYPDHLQIQTDICSSQRWARNYLDHCHCWVEIWRKSCFSGCFGNPV